MLQESLEAIKDYYDTFEESVKGLNLPNREYSLKGNINLRAKVEKHFNGAALRCKKYMLQTKQQLTMEQLVEEISGIIHRCSGFGHYDLSYTNWNFIQGFVMEKINENNLLKCIDN